MTYGIPILALKRNSLCCAPVGCWSTVCTSGTRPLYEDSALMSSMENFLSQHRRCLEQHNWWNEKRVFVCLGPNGELCKFLDGLAVANDVPSYVKDHFGHAALLTMPDKCTLHQVHFCTACGILTHGPTFFGNGVSIKMPPCPPAQMHWV
ncbi:hypothetical protein Salat_2344500 [Sesamum alatum]|uniref:Uncharacterized protein n=1 Tax=Sesamum alatum TaxID=300844 RepID=A0AAE2CEL4_9LAMI|nr:hypothetical protein Salat_2344500 [Sesamum alatum]